MERVEAADVRSGHDRSDQRVDLGLRQRVIARTGHLGAPAGGEVAVQIEPFRRRRRRDVEAVEVLDGAFVEHAVAGHVGVDAGRRDGHEQPVVVGMGDPRAVGVGEAHLEDAAVAIDVLLVETGPAMGVGERPRSHAGSPESGTVGEHPLGTIGVHPGHDVERAGAQRPGDRGVARSMAVDESLQQSARGDRGGQFDGVDAGVDPVRRFRVVRPGRGIGDGDQQQVASLERSAVGVDGDEVGVGGGELLDPVDQLVVAEEPVEAVLDHRGRLRAGSQRHDVRSVSRTTAARNA